MTIEINHLNFEYSPRQKVLYDVSLSVNQGETWAIIGKNGSGKSTLLKCIGSLLKPHSGSIIIQGKRVDAYRAIELSKILAYVPQASGRSMPPYTVFEYCMLGRFPYRGFFSIPTSEDRRIVDEALLLTDTAMLASRPMNELSGGEAQRVILASAVAQQPDILLLDEPVSFLDPLHQEMVQRSLVRIHDEFKVTILTITHDVNAALSRYSHIGALVNGRCVFAGPVEAFKAEASGRLKAIFSLAFSPITDATSGLQWFFPERIA